MTWATLPIMYVPVTIVATRPGEIVHADLLELTKTSSGNKHVLVLIDGLTKFDNCQYTDLAKPKSRASIFWLVSNTGMRCGQELFTCDGYATPSNPMVLFCGLYLVFARLKQNLKSFCTTNIANLQIFGKHL